MTRRPLSNREEMLLVCLVALLDLSLVIHILKTQYPTKGEPHANRIHSSPR